MRTTLPKAAIIALAVLSFALVYKAASADWKEYLMDAADPDVFNQYNVHASSPDLVTSRLDYSYDSVSFWRQAANKYALTNWSSSQGKSFSIAFANLSAAVLLSPPPLEVPGFINSSTVTQTNVSNVTVTGSGSSGTNTSVVLPGSPTGTSTDSTVSTGTTDSTGTLDTTGTTGTTTTTGTTGTTTTGTLIVVPSYNR